MVKRWIDILWTLVYELKVQTHVASGIEKWNVCILCAVVIKKHTPLILMAGEIW